MAVQQDSPPKPVVRWVLLLLGATLASMVLGFAAGLARPRTTTLPARVAPTPPSQDAA